MNLRIHVTGLALLIRSLLCAEVVPPFTDEGYRVPQPGEPLEFPEAHGSHPGFKIEWWYLTGHLFAEDGRRFGYQATFFRSALKPPHKQREATFGSNHLYLTHMALTDVESGAFHYQSRLARDGWDAWARPGFLDTRNGNWSLRLTGTTPETLQLEASVRSDASWSLVMQPVKPLVRFGRDGTSRKGPAAEARSYYLSFTRLRTSGTIVLEGERIEVTGSSWMDHEIASNQLDPSYEGWDWIAIQLENGWDVKAYLLREADGSPGPFSALIWISPEGVTYPTGREAFSWSRDDRWESPETGARWPIRPVLRTTHPLTGEPVQFSFLPLMEAQELAFPGTTYWEGAGDVRDESGMLVGTAYLELVGYAGPIEGLR